MASSKIQTATLARTLVAATAATALLASATIAAADPRDGGQAYGQQVSVADNGHANWGQNYSGDHQWRRGQRIGYNDWSGAQPVDYRAHHLRHPPRGYEWRESRGQYVMAAVASGVIASIILSNGR